jgi:hypothetical protein
MKDTQVQGAIHADSILIRDGTLFPRSVDIKSEPFVPGWRLVKDFDGHGLDRAVREAGWTYFCLSGEIRASVFGLNEQSMLRKAITRIVAKPRSTQFNSLEITRVTSKSFLGVRYMIVDAKLRHIQESLFLFSPESIQDSRVTESAALRARAWGPAPPAVGAPAGTNGRAGVPVTPNL